MCDFMKAIGLISGTSVDGIDAVLVDIFDEIEEADTIRLQVAGFATYPYPAGVRERLLAVADAGRGRVEELCHLNAYLGELFAEAAIRIARDTGIALSEIAVIGSHGQTVQHRPQPTPEQDRLVRSTLQLGEPSIIAERTGVTTVADFRPRDMAAGGQGAPFAPYAHYRLFRHAVKTRIIVNIGGISNLTHLPPAATPDQVLAFDTGPGNMLLDQLVRELTGDASVYDLDGQWAAQGTCQAQLLAWLLTHPYLRRTPPKSTGREDFGAQFVRCVLAQQRKLGVSDADLLATVTQFTAEAIGYSMRHFLPGRGNFPETTDMLCCGGGVHNQTLMTALQTCVAPMRVGTVEQENIESDAVEAITFALLARETLRGTPANLPSVTGAAHPVVLGKIAPGNRFRGPML
jgi:anhydro-N-acetylmuramic acid kinase